MYKSEYEWSTTEADIRRKCQVLLRRKKRCYGEQKRLVLKFHTILFLLYGGFKCYLLVPVAVKSIVECNKMIQLLKNDEGVEFVLFTEGPKKTRQGGL